MKKPRIGVVGNILIQESGMLMGSYRTYVNHNYITSIEKAGGIPVLLPVLHNLEDVKEQLEGLDGVLLTGGYDVDPELYGEKISEKCGYVMREVDVFNLAVIHAADELHLPVFGICKGIQIMNVAFGGTIYQNQADDIKNCLKHDQSAPRYQGTHDIEIDKDSFIGHVLGSKTRVNSFHHQSLKKVADGFKVTAKASDGVIEGIEREHGSFMAAVQFHPEMMAEFDNPDMIALFKAFVEVCHEK